MQQKKSKPDQCILVFVKSPEKGKVKTRLAKDVGNDLAVRLYRNFVRDIIDTVKASPYETRICFLPEAARSGMARWLGADLVMNPQEGKDLGERLANAFTDAFAEGFRQVIVIGTDSPDLSESHLKEAFDGLETHDAVIGPAFDGGYYMIGFNHDTFPPAVFENMPWSDPALYATTRAFLDNRDLRVIPLRPWLDIDTLDDLERFMEKNAGSPNSAPHTTGFLIGRDAPLRTPDE